MYKNTYACIHPNLTTHVATHLHKDTCIIRYHFYYFLNGEYDKRWWKRMKWMLVDVNVNVSDWKMLFKTVFLRIIQI